MSDIREQLGRNIREARERLGLRQEDLRSCIGANSSQIISAIEKGEREVKAWELAAIARLLQVDMLELLSAEGLRLGPVPLWRNPGGETKARIEVRLGLRMRRCRFLLEVTGVRPPESLPVWEWDDLEKASYAQARERARELWQSWNLGPRPALTLIPTLEDRFCVMVFYEDLGADGSAVCVRDGAHSAILLNKREAPWRRTYSVAHELFHLLTWDAPATRLPREDDSIKQRLEKLADAFASELLLPEEPLRDEVRKHMDDQQLPAQGVIATARRFGVSTSALLWRMKNLGWIGSSDPSDLLADPDFRHEDKRSTKGLWDDPDDLPFRFVSLAVVAHSQGRLSKARLAEILETDLASLPRLLEHYGLNLEIDAVYEAEGLPA